MIFSHSPLFRTQATIMKFKLSQITVLVVSALSVSAGVAATDIDIVGNKTSGGNGYYQTEFTGGSLVNTPVEYTGSIKDSNATSVFVGNAPYRPNN